MPLKKQFAAEYKALSPEEGGAPGEFSAIVAVYNNVDSAGDRIKSGAFDETLAAWKKSGDPIPIILAHLWNDPWAHIGYADPKDVESIPGRGLHLKKGILDVEDNPLAQQVYRLMQRRTLKEFSFGYRVPPGGERKAQDGAFDLLKLDLIEFGPCLKGVNSETELLAIKAEIEAGRREGDEPTVSERLARLEASVARLVGKAEGGEIEEIEEVAPECTAEHPCGREDCIACCPVVDEPKGDERMDDDGAPPADEPEDKDEKAEAPEADIELMLRQQAIEALEVECRDVFAKDHALDDTVRTLDAYDRLLED